MYVQISKNQVFDSLVCNGACNKYSLKWVDEKSREGGKRDEWRIEEKRKEDERRKHEKEMWREKERVGDEMIIRSHPHPRNIDLCCPLCGRAVG